MKRILFTVAVALTVQACGAGSEAGADTGAAAAADTLTRAQKDTLLSTMPMPGARGVGGAMRARDAANARTQGHDTIR